MKKHIIPFVISTIISATILTLYLGIKRENIKVNGSQNRLVALQTLTVLADNIQREINESFVYTEFLEILVRQHDYRDIERFDEYGSLIVSKSKVITNIEIAKDGIINMIYPIDGNESSIGYNLMKKSEIYASIKAAIDLKVPVSQGPIIALNGRYSVFNRKAIFDDRSGEDQFWGLAIVSIDFEELMRESGLMTKSDLFSFALASERENGEDNFVWGDRDVFNKDYISKDIELSYQKWKIGVYPKNGWNESIYKMTIADVFILLLIILLFILLYYYALFYQEQREVSKLDGLTKTYNIKAFRELVDKKINKSGEKFIFILFDINKFKNINDTYGHPIGDKVLIYVSNQIKSKLSHKDYLSRLGGDEFVVLINYKNSDISIKAIISSILDEIEKPLNLGETKLSISMSAGYSLFPEDGFEYDELYMKADKMMYEIKNNSRFCDENDIK